VQAQHLSSSRRAIEGRCHYMLANPARFTDLQTHWEDVHFLCTSCQRSVKLAARCSAQRCQRQATSGALAMQQRLSLDVLRARHGSPSPFSCLAKSASGKGPLPFASCCNLATSASGEVLSTVHLGGTPIWLAARDDTDSMVIQSMHETSTHLLDSEFGV
jgi:hypothetical protein